MKGIIGNRKRLVIAIAALLFVVALAACSGGSGNETATGNETPAAPASEETNAANGSATAEPAEPSGPPPAVSIITSHNGVAYGVQETDWEDNIYVKELERIMGYDLDIDVMGHADDYRQQLTVRFVSGDLADLVRTDAIDAAAHHDAVEQGAFHELNDLLEQYGQHILAAFPDDIWGHPRISKDGKIYAIPLRFERDANRVVYYRQDYLDKLNMNVPETLEQFLNFCEAVKTTDLNGDGQQNEYCFYVREDFKFSENFFGSFGVYPDIWEFRDGEFVPQAILPEMKAPIAFWRDLYAGGYINPDFLTNQASSWNAGIYQGVAASWEHAMPSYVQSWQPKNFSDPHANIIPALPPEGPGGRGLFPKVPLIWHVWVIPKSVEDPERVVKFLDDVWASEEAKTFFYFGIEGRNHTVENGQIVFDLDNNPYNKENSEFLAFQNILSLIGRNNDVPELIATYSEDLKGILAQGYEVAALGGMDKANLNMPNPEVFSRHPELNPTIDPSNTLFVDMLARVVTGRDDLDTAFDQFVAEWRSRGGDEAIKEATEWYNNNNKP